MTALASRLPSPDTGPGRNALDGLVRARFPLAVHVTIGTALREPRLREADVAEAVFGFLREHPRTLAAVVVPDHVHWLLRGGWDLSEAVDGFKAQSDRVAAVGGEGRSLWQRSFFDAPVETETIVKMSARFLLANPVVAGLVLRWQDYPWAYLDRSLGG